MDNIVGWVSCNDFDIVFKIYIGIANLSCKFWTKLALCYGIFWKLGYRTRVLKLDLHIQNQTTQSESLHMQSCANSVQTFFDLIQIHVQEHHSCFYNNEAHLKQQRPPK